MAEFSGPWANEPLPDDRYQRLFSRLGGGLLRPPGPLVSINAGATALTVPGFEAVARGRYFHQDSTRTVTPAAASSQRRIDRLVLRLDPAAETHASLRLIQGTPSATPTPPAIMDVSDGVFDIPLARVEVHPTAPTLRNLVNEAPSAGYSVIPCLANTRPGDGHYRAPGVGQPIWDTTLGRMLVWDGVEWADPVPVHRRRSWVAERATSGSSFADHWPGSWTQLLSLTVSEAFEGDWLINVTLLLQTVNGATSAGTMRLSVNGVNRDHRCDVDGLARPLSYHFAHRQVSEGPLVLTVSHSPTSAGVEIRTHNNGTKLTASWLGHRGNV